LKKQWAKVRKLNKWRNQLQSVLTIPKEPDLKFWIFGEFSDWWSRRGHIPCVKMKFMTKEISWEFSNCKVRLKSQMLILILRELFNGLEVCSRKLIGETLVIELKFIREHNSEVNANIQIEAGSWSNSTYKNIKAGAKIESGAGCISSNEYLTVGSDMGSHDTNGSKARDLRTEIQEGRIWY
jgi:hypothetical protein